MADGGPSLHPIAGDRREVQLRVFVPAPAAAAPGGGSGGGGGKPPGGRPAVLMVCGLLFMGGGLMGWMGEQFNDDFGRAFAKRGVPCVQIHTPGRHCAHARLFDVFVVLLWVVTFVPYLRVVILVADVCLLATAWVDVGVLALVPLVASRCHRALALPVLHLIMRGLQWLKGDIPGPEYRDYQKEIAAAVAWMKENQELLGSDGRLVLSGYSSGGHCACMYALSEGAPRFERYLMISSIYTLRTQSWTDNRRFWLWLFYFGYRDLLGVDTAEKEDKNSPELLVKPSVSGQTWYVTHAKNELLFIPYLAECQFEVKPFCDALRAAGATVHSVQCGANHWALKQSVTEFIGTFSEGLLG